MRVPVPPHLLVYVGQQHPHSVHLNSECHSFSPQKYKSFLSPGDGVCSWSRCLTSVIHLVHFALVIAILHVQVWAVFEKALCGGWRQEGSRSGIWQDELFWNVCLFCDFREKKLICVLVCYLLGAWSYTALPTSNKLTSASLSGFGTVSVYIVIWECRVCWLMGPLAFVHIDKTFCAIGWWVIDVDAE